MENCNHELVRVQDKCGKTVDTIPPSADWEVLEKLEADTLRFMVVDLQSGIERMDVAQRTEREEWRSLEKQYSGSLGALAKLCDTVCPWVLANPPELIPVNVAIAAAEIMEYVNLVRPPSVTIFQCGPSKCEHDYQGHEDILNEDGQCVGGTTVCTKCGARAILRDAATIT